MKELATEEISGLVFQYPANKFGIKPAWIQSLLRGAYRAAIRPLLQAGIGDIIDFLGVTLRGTQSPVLLSAELEPGTYGIERGFIVLNEQSALARAADCDGDRAIVDDKYPGVVLKYPQTTLNPLVWKRVDYVPKPRLSSFTDRDFTVTSYNEESDFKKVHVPVETGLHTWSLTNMQFYQHKGLPSINKVIKTFSDPIRYQVIEENGLKTVRKDGKDLSGQSLFEENVLNVTHRIPRTEYMCTLSGNSLGSMSEKDVDILIDWLTGGYIDNVYRRFTRLDFSFIPNATPDSPSVDMDRKGVQTVQVSVQSLIKMGVIKIHEVPTDTGHNGYIVQLLDPSGKPVILQEAKRSDLVAGFQFVVYPSFGFVNGSPSLLSLTRLLNEAIASIRNLSRVKNKEHFYSDGYKYHRNRIMKAILKTVGMYGDMISLQNGRPTDIANLIIRSTVCFRYDQEPTYEQALQLQHVVGKKLCLSGGKSKNPSIHKYLLARENGTPITSHPEAHCRRAGNLRAQLLQSQPIGICKVAVLRTGSNEQALCTRQGKPKQVLSLQSLSLISPIETEKCTEPIQYRSWSGKIVKGFRGDRDTSIEVGKILDSNGFKCQLREVDWEVTDQNGEAIHFIIPPQVIQDKGLDRVYYPKGEVQTVQVTLIDEETGEEHTQSYEAIVFNHFFFRSGDPAENIPPGPVTHRVTGFDSLSIRAVLAMERGVDDLGIPYPEEQLRVLKRNLNNIFSLLQQEGISTTIE